MAVLSYILSLQQQPRNQQAWCDHQLIVRRSERGSPTRLHLTSLAVTVQVPLDSGNATDSLALWRSQLKVAATNVGMIPFLI